jgi:hypothetical protein
VKRSGGRAVPTPPEYPSFGFGPTNDVEVDVTVPRGGASPASGTRRSAGRPRSRRADDAFFDACRRFYERFNGRSAGTDDFRAFWSVALKDDPLLRSWLDSPGRGPVPVR